MRHHLPRVPCLVLLAVAAAAAVETVGYRGPGGTCVFPDSDPPLAWDDRTGRNILWKAPTANWGHGMPIVVDDRVLAVSEPGWRADFPVLQCWDADSGEELWRTEIDHLSCLPADRRDGLRTAYARLWKLCRQAYRARYRKWKARGDKAARAAIDEEIAASGALDVRKGKIVPKPLEKGLAKRLAAAGLQIDHWHWPGYGSKICCIGSAFPTPVSDGERIWVATGMDSFACFDMNGEMQWIRHIPGKRGEFCRYGRSPLLHGNLLIADSGNLTRAIDKRSGELVWSHPQDAHEMETPTVLRADGTDVLLVPGVKAYRLPDGKPLRVTGWSDHGLVMVTKHDEPDVVFFSGGGQHGGWGKESSHRSPAAVRFRLQGDTLAATVLWEGIPGQRKGGGGLGLVYHDGRVYHMSGAILDADDGTLLGHPGSRHCPRAVPETRHLLMLAGDRLYGSAGPAMVSDRAKGDGLRQYFPIVRLDGRRLGSGGPLVNPPFTGEKEEQWAATAGNELYPVSYGGVFVVAGDRIYARSSDFIYCIGHATRDWPADDAEALAALAETEDPAVAAASLDAASPRRRLLALQALARCGDLGGSERRVRALLADDPHPEVRGAAAAALDASDPAAAPGWAALRDRLLEIENTLRGGAWKAAHRRLHQVIAGMGPDGRERLVAELEAAGDPKLIRSLLHAAGDAGWVTEEITAAAKAYVADWKPGAGHDKHAGSGVAGYLCAAVAEPDVAELLWRHRYAPGDNGEMANRVESTLAFHTPAAIRLAWARECEGKTRTTKNGTVLRTCVPELIHALRGLAALGPEAAEALPWLRELAGDTDRVVAGTAAWAAAAIAPGQP